MRGATVATDGADLSLTISTHAPHARRDVAITAKTPAITISTHAPHARRDDYVERLVVEKIHFYSRASCEARLEIHSPSGRAENISTHAPHARRDDITNMRWIAIGISTHAPHARRDSAQFLASKRF